MRLRLGLALLTFLALPASAEETQVGAGPIEVELELSKMPSCVLPMDELPCPLGYDDNSTLDPSDDVLYQYRAVETARVSVEGPLPPTSLVMEPEETRVPHHHVDTVDSVLIPAEAALPAPIGDHTRTRQGRNETWLIITVLDPAPVTNSPLYVGVPVAASYTDRNGTRLPNGFGAEGDDSDDWGRDVFTTLRLCWARQLGGNQALVCDAVPLAAESEASWPSLTPQVLTGVAVNRTEVAVGPSEEAETSPVEGAAPPISHEDGASPVTGSESRDAEWQGTSEPSSPWSQPDPSPSARAPMTLQATAARAGTPALPSSAWPAVLAAAAALLALALFHRITGKRVLEHRHRARLLELAKQHPGLGMSEAARALGLSHHTTAHHADVLARGGHIELVGAGRRVAIYPVGVVPLRFRSPIVQLRSPPLHAALLSVRRHPGRGLTELATLQGCQKSSAHAKLERLRAAGLVEREAQGTYHVTALGEETLRMMERLEIVQGDASPGAPSRREASSGGSPASALLRGGEPQGPEGKGLPSL